MGKRKFKKQQREKELSLIVHAGSKFMKDCIFEYIFILLSNFTDNLTT